MKRKVEYFLKHTPWIMNLIIVVGSAVLKFIGLFIKQDDKMILFVSFSGKQYNDSPKAIYDYICRNKVDRGYHCVWAFEHPEDFPEVDCEKVKIDTPSYFLTTLKAKYWVASVNIERGLKYKKKTQIYLNTWHGPAINLMGNAVEGRNDFNWNHVDYFCISGKYEVPIITRDFRVLSENLLMSGLPRNDELHNATESKKAELRKKFGVPDSKKVILYAPTWRESTDGGKTCNLRPPIDLHKWENKLGDEFVLFIRAHVNTREMLGVKYNNFVRNGSDYPVVNDLLIIADYLISDYSSIIMDYSILGRPIICFGYDFDEYNKARGGFYFDLDKEIPSGVCHTEEEVLDYILNNDYKGECKKAQAFRDRHIEFGGHATEICTEKLLKK